MASTVAGVTSAMANLAMQLGNIVALVVAISARALARAAALIWPARASHAFKRWAGVRFTGMFRL